MGTLGDEPSHGSADGVTDGLYKALPYPMKDWSVAWIFSEGVSNRMYHPEEGPEINLCPRPYHTHRGVLCAMTILFPPAV